MTGLSVMMAAELKFGFIYFFFFVAGPHSVLSHACLKQYYWSHTGA